MFPSISSVFDKRRVTINRLPDEVLLRIFHFDRMWHEGRYPSWRWHRLVHVCRRWRSVGFASPNFLKLRLVCGPETPVKLTGIWPHVPIVIRDEPEFPLPEDYDFNAAIVHPNRVYEINLHNLNCFQMQRLASEMQEPFPALKHLRLSVVGLPASDLPEGFLGGTSPCLRSLRLEQIAFHALPRFLLSTTDLVCLSLWDIPHSEPLSPEAIVSGLAVLPNLRFLAIGFEFLSGADCRRLHPPPLTHTILPALTSFKFRGVSEYLEKLLAQIDAPLLVSVRIGFTRQLLFDIPQLAQFMRRTTRIGALDDALVHVHLYEHSLLVRSLPQGRTLDKKFKLTISCRKKDWRLPSISPLAHTIASFFPFLYMVEHLYIQLNESRYSPLGWQHSINLNNRLWLEVFRLFTAVKSLYVCKEFVECNAISWSLQELFCERVANTLPALENLFLEELQPSEPVQEAIGQLVAARQLLSHPVTVSQWNRDME